MNWLEWRVYQCVENCPRLKKGIVGTYRAMFSMVPAKDVVSDFEMKVREGFFVGFHDICPWSGDGQMLLAHRFQIPNRMPDAGEPVEIGYFMGPGYMTYRRLGTTRCWNWQTGSRLQWLGETRKLVFNDFDGGGTCARVIDVDHGDVGRLPRAVDAVSPDGTKAVGYGFERLRRWSAGYAYRYGSDAEEDASLPERSGLYAIDTGSCETTDLFSVAEIANIEPAESMRHAYHFFSHCQFAPSGGRFAFFHRWLGKNGRLWRLRSRTPRG